MKQGFFILSLLLIPILNSCTEKKVIDEEKFILIYSDLLIIQDTSSVPVQDSMRSVVFRRHNISEEDFKETINFYNDEPGRWEQFFNKAIAHVETLRYKKTLK